LDIFFACEGVGFTLYGSNFGGKVNNYNAGSLLFLNGK